MIRLTLLVAGLGLFPVTVFSDAAATLSCPEALEQIATLNTLQPVYKLTGADKRHYIHDRDRPAEISRLLQHGAQDQGRAASGGRPAARGTLARLRGCARRAHRYGTAELPPVL